MKRPQEEPNAAKRSQRPSGIEATRKVENSDSERVNRIKRLVASLLKRFVAKRHISERKYLELAFIGGDTIYDLCEKEFSRQEKQGLHRENRNLRLSAREKLRRASRLRLDLFLESQTEIAPRAFSKTVDDILSKHRGNFYVLSQPNRSSLEDAIAFLWTFFAEIQQVYETLSGVKYGLSKDYRRGGTKDLRRRLATQPLAVSRRDQISLEESTGKIIEMLADVEDIIDLLPFEMAAHARALMRDPVASAVMRQVLLRPERTLEPFVMLTPTQLEAYRKQAAEFQWDNRQSLINPDTGKPWAYHTNAFEFIRAYFMEWIPGLAREDITESDRSLSAHLKRKISLGGGLPTWLDLPSRPEARLRAIEDPRERERLIEARRYLAAGMRARRQTAGD